MKNKRPISPKAGCRKRTARSQHPVVGPGDRIQIGTKLVSGEVWWGSVQTVLRFYDGRPMYRPKWAKVDKIATHWRRPNDDKVSDAAH